MSGTRYDFSGLHAVMQRYVDQDLLAGVSSAVLVGQDLVDLHCAGHADREAGTALTEDHLFRVFSNTKLVTSCMILLLMEDGLLSLDDPVETFLPQLANRQVLRPDATSAADTEPAASPMLIRHLLSHSSGLSYGVLDPGTLVYGLYSEAQIHDPTTDLEEMVNRLEALPLSYHPGTGWEYSIATDVLGRVVEVVCGAPFDAVLKQRIFEPLGMRDTGFTVPEADQGRLAAHYKGADLQAPMEPGLTRCDDDPYPQAYRRDFARKSGGGGLYSSLPDMIALIRALIPGGQDLLKPETCALFTQNQLADGVNIRFPRLGEVKGKVYGPIGAITTEPMSIEPAGARGEVQWGGIAGTHWWFHPEKNIAGLNMSQRVMAFWHPFSFELKQQVYSALGA